MAGFYQGLESKLKSILQLAYMKWSNNPILNTELALIQLM